VIGWTSIHAHAKPRLYDLGLRGGIREADAENQRDTALVRLCSGIPQRNDEGYAHLLQSPPALEEITAFFGEQRRNWRWEPQRRPNAKAGSKFLPYRFAHQLRSLPPGGGSCRRGYVGRTSVPLVPAFSSGILMPVEGAVNEHRATRKKNRPMPVLSPWLVMVNSDLHRQQAEQGGEFDDRVHWPQTTCL